MRFDKKGRIWIAIGYLLKDKTSVNCWCMQSAYHLNLKVFEDGSKSLVYYPRKLYSYVYITPCIHGSACEDIAQVLVP